MKQSKMFKYLSPRLIIINGHQKVTNLKQKLTEVHQNYLHVFNFTKFKINGLTQTQYKWRGIPYSLTQTIKFLSDLDNFYRVNCANTALLLVENGNLYQYGLFLALCYTRVCQISSNQILNGLKNIKYQHPFALSQFQTVYIKNKLENPPLKIIEQIQIQSLDSSKQFIPVFQIYTQTRYNDFELVYNHQICEQLINYYIKLNQNLPTSYGIRYDQGKPQTSYLKKPALVYGDVKINIYSFEKIKLKKECTIGFSTYYLNNNQEYLIIPPDDFYDGSGNYNIIIKITPFCDQKQCAYESKCIGCKQISKVAAMRYKETQPFLQSLNRKRTLSEVNQLLSI